MIVPFSCVMLLVEIGAVINLLLTYLILKINNIPTNWWGRKNASPLKFDPEPSEAAFSTVVRTLINADQK